jgi:hypothetical protein
LVVDRFRPKTESSRKAALAVRREVAPLAELKHWIHSRRQTKCRAALASAMLGVSRAAVFRIEPPARSAMGE